jgi:hypothetical protein
MVRSVASLLVLLQLGLVISPPMNCMAQIPASADCPMAAAAQGASSQHHDSSHHHAPTGSQAPACCPLALRCNAPVTLNLHSLLNLAGPLPASRVLIPALLVSPLTIDPLAPPVPPPNA